MTTWPGPGRGELARDLALAGASLVGGLVLLSLGTYRQITASPDVPPLVFLATLVTVCVAIALRRIAPLTSLAIGTAALAIDLACGLSLATALVYTQVLFDACVYGPQRLWRWLLWIVLALTGLAVLLGVVFVLPWSWQGVAMGVPVVLVGVLPVLTGVSVRQYRDQAAAEVAQAEQAALLAELDRRQAVTAERSRMARELHDVIANHLSAVAIHATAALSVAGLDRAQVDQALRVIRENSVQGLAEMRQMIGLLRDPAGAGQPTPEPTSQPAPRPMGRPTPEPTSQTDPEPTSQTDPGSTGPARLVVTAGSGAVAAVDGPARVRLAEVDRLVAQARNAGLSVRFETTGHARPLPVSVDLAAYRIVQESLTNALKHGSGPAEVVVGYQTERVSVTIENPLAERPGGGPGTLPGAGVGLVGMRERAALLHGRFSAGPRERRWRVHAELPLTETAREPAL